MSELGYIRETFGRPKGTKRVLGWAVGLYVATQVIPGVLAGLFYAIWIHQY